MGTDSGVTPHGDNLEELALTAGGMKPAAVPHATTAVRRRMPRRRRRRPGNDRGGQARRPDSARRRPPSPSSECGVRLCGLSERGLGSRWCLFPESLANLAPPISSNSSTSVPEIPHRGRSHHHPTGPSSPSGNPDRPCSVRGTLHSDRGFPRQHQHQTSQFWDLTEADPQGGRPLRCATRSSGDGAQPAHRREPSCSTSPKLVPSATSVASSMRSCPSRGYYEHDDHALRTESLQEDEFRSGHAHIRQQQDR